MGKKGAVIKRMDGCCQKLQYTHYNEKKKNKQGEGGRVKDNESLRVK